MNRKYLILVKFKYAINYMIVNQIFHCFLLKSKIHKFEKIKKYFKTQFGTKYKF